MPYAAILSSPPIGTGPYVLAPKRWD